ncbi:hypothetical protein [Deinococcus arenicola]|uniref:PI-PLC Y-box domain-containing protein n=1 Tax=Deinococcus arenicola TaxID=2994950 RepID=A0ABU4DPR9_9DEIO|nr:hypothetical protein [Deinococcus sp. ZS9-10]MDV6374416.1 hypothetical protein [Deinococcus sp. ZS9-10]
MSILYVHGVAIREGDQPQWETLKRVTHGALWEEVRTALQTHVAPSVNPADPGGVDTDWVYWGDLGASLAHENHGQRGRLPAGPPLTLSAAALADELERGLRPEVPAGRWPELVEACWAAAQDSGVRAVIGNVSAAVQWPVALSAVRSRLHLEGAQLPQRLRLRRRQNMRRAMQELRRPLEGFVPYFVGDALQYFTSRGTPQQPGPIAARVLTALKKSWHLSRERNEPLVIVTHSMGGQLVYDALTTFIPANPEFSDLRAAVWCAAASQVGPCKDLGLFLDDQSGEGTALVASPHLDYFWNVWSENDLLSFPAEGSVLGAHDTAFALGGRSPHMAYLQRPEFYRTLAARVRVQVAREAVGKA